MPKLDQRSSKMDKSINKGDTKNDKNYMNQSSITPNPNSAAKKSNKMLRQKNSINGTNTPNNNSINNNSINNNSSNNNQYQYLTDKYGHNKFVNNTQPNVPQKIILSNILQNINLNSNISKKRKKSTTGNSSMRSDYEDIRTKSQTRDNTQSRDYSFNKDMKQPDNNLKTTKVTTGSRKNSTSVNKPRPKANGTNSSYYNYSLNVSRNGKY